MTTKRPVSDIRPRRRVPDHRGSQEKNARAYPGRLTLERRLQRHVGIMSSVLIDKQDVREPSFAGMTIGKASLTQVFVSVYPDENNRHPCSLPLRGIEKVLLSFGIRGYLRLRVFQVMHER